MTKKTKEPSLTANEISRQTLKGTKKYEKLSFLEQFAMYMGVAQILELQLKKFLSEKYNYDLDKLEKKTLGWTAKELEKNKLRPDFILLLNEVVEYRNYIAHELLANEILYKTLMQGSMSENHYSKEARRLHKAIYSIEQLAFLFDWTQENDAWG